MITNEPFLVLRRYDLSLEPFKLQVGINSFTTNIDDKRVHLSYDFGLPLYHRIESCPQRSKHKWELATSTSWSDKRSAELQTCLQ